MSSSQPKHQTPILIPPFIKITKEIGVGTVVQERALDGRGDPGGLESCASFTMFVGISVKLSTWMHGQTNQTNPLLRTKIPSLNTLKKLK